MLHFTSMNMTMLDSIVFTTELILTSVYTGLMIICFECNNYYLKYFIFLGIFS